MASGYFTRRIPNRTPKKRSENRIRPRTYNTLAAAKTAAETSGLKGYSIQNLRSETAKVGKFRIVEQ